MRTLRKTLFALLGGVAGIVTLFVSFMKWPSVVASCVGLVVLLASIGISAASAWWLLAAAPIWFVMLIVSLVITAVGLAGATV